jgi:hypothetical protein
MPCTECFQLVPVPVRDDSAYKFTCPDGHQSLIWLQNEKHDILFEGAGLALLDGYIREAAFGLASALERFLEFAVRALSLQLGIPPEEQEATWKILAKQSERQLGMFLGMWLVHTKTAAVYLEGKWVEFRNNVVHNGYVPTEPQVMAYGDRVLAYIDDRLDVLDRTAVEGMNVALARRIQGPPLTEPGYLEGRIFVEMVLCGKERPRTFGAAIDEIRERRPRAYLQSGPT